MPKPLLRIVALLLAPCLLANLGTVSAREPELGQNSNWILNSNPFKAQALGVPSYASHLPTRAVGARIIENVVTALYAPNAEAETVLMRAVHGESLNEEDFAVLRDFTLKDPTHGVYGVDRKNVDQAVATRLDILKRVWEKTEKERLRKGITTSAIGELWTTFIPESQWVLERKQRLRSHEAYIYGIQGSPGQGKSTRVGFLKVILEELLQSNAGQVVVISIDDYYKTLAEREKMQREGFNPGPGMSNRGPGTIDWAAAKMTLDGLRHSTDVSAVQILRFNKGIDDRDYQAMEKEGLVRGKVAVVLLEGYVVGINPEIDISKIKAGTVARKVAEGIATQSRLVFDMIDDLLAYEPLPIEKITENRIQQEHTRRLLQPDKPGMTDEQLRSFVAYHVVYSWDTDYRYSSPVPRAEDCSLIAEVDSSRRIVDLQPGGRFVFSVRHASDRGPSPIDNDATRQGRWLFGRPDPVTHSELVRDLLRARFEGRFGSSPDVSRIHVGMLYPNEAVRKEVYIHPDGSDDELLLYMYIFDGDPAGKGTSVNGILLPIKLDGKNVKAGRPWIETSEHEDPWMRPIEADVALPAPVVDHIQQRAQSWVEEHEKEVLEVLEAWRAKKLEPKPIAVTVTPGEEKMLRHIDLPGLLMFDRETGLYTRRDIGSLPEEEVIYRQAQRGIDRQSPAAPLDEAMMMFQAWWRIGVMSPMAREVEDNTITQATFRRWLEANHDRIATEDYLIRLRQEIRSRLSHPALTAYDHRQIQRVLELLRKGLNDVARAAAPADKPHPFPPAGQPSGKLKGSGAGPRIESGRGKERHRRISDARFAAEMGFSSKYEIRRNTGFDDQNTPAGPFKLPQSEERVQFVVDVVKRYQSSRCKGVPVTRAVFEDFSASMALR